MINNSLFDSKSQPSDSPLLLPSQISINEIRRCAQSGELGEDFQSSSPSSSFPTPFSSLDLSRKGEGGARFRSDLSGEIGGVSPEGERSESLLYLNSNISTENHIENTLDSLCSLLSPYQNRLAYSLKLNVDRLINLAPEIGYMGFMTLTFKENIICPKEASKRFNSFNSHFLKVSPEFTDWLGVRERQKRGAWHYHLLVTLSQDIKDGFDWELYDFALKFREPMASYWSPKNKVYRKYMAEATKTANEYLHAIWSMLREACKKYGFGRSEILPIKTNIKAMNLYVGKYVSKELGGREGRDKGVRLISYSQNWTKNSMKFQWNTEGSFLWRKKLQLFAKVMGVKDQYDLTKKLGSSWAYHYADDIMNIDNILIENNCDLESLEVKTIPDVLIEKMKKHENIREAKKVRLCHHCNKKGIRQWQGHDLYCARCGGLIF